MPQNELPEKYYLDYYQVVLTDVKRKYYNLLHVEEQVFLDILLDLNENALCLWIRMANRKKLFFRDKDLKYREIDITAAKIDLEDEGLIKLFSIYDTKQFEYIVAELTKSDIIATLKAIKVENLTALKKLPKNELVHHTIHSTDKKFFIKELTKTEFWFCELKELDKFLKYLYFGFISTDLTPFVIRDLGNVRFEDFEEETLAPRFETREEIDISWDLAEASEYMYFLITNCKTALEVYHWFDEWNRHLKRKNWSAYALRRYNRIVIKVAMLLDKVKQYEYAITVYSLTELPPARERLCRIYNIIGSKQKALAICQRMQNAPDSAQELYFGRYYFDKLMGQKLLLPTTQYLKKCNTIKIDKEWKYQVENGTIEYYQQRGCEGIHSENWLWRSVLGLLLWEVIFDSKDAAITSPFQRVPSSFMSKDYYLNRKQKIDEQLDLIDDKEALMQLFTKVFNEKYGVSNPLVMWHEHLLVILFLLIERLTSVQLKTILHQMIINPAHNLRGFPDLMIWNEYTIEFIEVKGPGDSLSFQQLFWIEFLTELGVNIKAEKVKWLT